MKLDVYLKIAPQCISIIGPNQSGKTTILQEISMDWFSTTRADLRSHTPDLFWMDAFTELPNQSFLELYSKKLKSFCTTPAKGKCTRMVVIDDVDLYSIKIQNQIYALVQRHKFEVHICISYTCSTRVLPELIGQFIPISVSSILNNMPSDNLHKIHSEIEKTNIDIMSVIHSSILLLTVRKGTVKSRSAKMAELWLRLHKSGLLLSDIFSLIGEGILTSPALTDSQIFELYSCYKKCPVDIEHCVFIYLLADAFATCVGAL